MRVAEAEAWLNVPTEEKLNICHSEESMFPLRGTANQKKNIRWALPENMEEKEDLLIMSSISQVNHAR